MQNPYLSDTSSLQEDAISAASFKPGARHVLSVTCNGEAMLTASNGAFEDIGRDMKGNLGSGKGVSCHGRRYTVTRSAKTHLFIWNAPSKLDLGNKSDVVFMVTAASGVSQELRQSAVTLSTDDDLERPIKGPSKRLDARHDAVAVLSISIVACGIVATTAAAAAAYKKCGHHMNTSYLQMVMNNNASLRTSRVRVSS